MEILVISGLSGAGKSCAASCLEDIGYYTVDNMPAAIIPKFAEFSAESDGRYDRVALVNDIRGGVDSFQELLEVIDRLREGGTVCRLLYLEADTQSIIKRYKETRRRADLVMEQQAFRTEEYQQAQIGKTVEVLAESYDRYAESWFGRTQGDAPDIDGKVFFKAPRGQVHAGDFVQVRVTDYMDWDLIGEAE